MPYAPNVMPQPARLRFVVDTNVWISYLLTGSFAALVRSWNSERFILLYSEGLLSEMRDVLSRPRIVKRISPDAADTFLAAMQRHATLVKVTSVINVCRDKKDNYLPALSKDSAAELLITGAEDLHVIGSF
jgi:putative PIN family toxin of toxin-antitoxin system